MFVKAVFPFLVALQGALAIPTNKLYTHIEQHDGNAHRHPTNELDLLFRGNEQFKLQMSQMDPDYLNTLATDGQKPPFMMLSCSDSRLSEGTIFSAKPGTIFTHRNIANLFHLHDPNANSVFSYAIAALGVKHVIVMGHYGCGGIAAAIASPPPPPLDSETAAVQAWISPIRELYAQSTRKEIVELRAHTQNLTTIPAPGHSDPGFRALVEENVKDAVQRIARSSAYKNHLHLLKQKGSNRVNPRAAKGEPVDLFIHGWVFDVSNGEVKDLGVSVGPPGKSIPKIPFPKAKGPRSRNLFGKY